MNLYKIRGGTEQELLDKKYNIGIGISLGNKWFTPTNILEQIKWALQYTHEYVVVYVADLIHAINLEVRNDISHERAVRVSVNKGEKILQEVKNLIETSLAESDKQKIRYATWSDLLTVDYVQKTKYLYDLYEQDENFRERLHSIVRGYTANEAKSFSESEIHRLGMYIIEELPEMVARVPIKDMAYDANAYPHSSGVVELVDEIQQGLAFSEIKEKIMDTEPKVFLEVR